MTIHDSHPFPTPDDPVRRLRGRLGGQVTLWCSGRGVHRAGLTVSSLMIAGGEPGHVLGLIDPDSDLADEVEVGSRLTVSLLGWSHRRLADAFAGVAPAPGGPFKVAEFTDTDWGPLPVGVAAWAGVSVAGLRQVGWSSEVSAVIDTVEIGDEDDDGDPLFHRRGRYRR